MSFLGGVGVCAEGEVREGVEVGRSDGGGGGGGVVVCC